MRRRAVAGVLMVSALCCVLGVLTDQGRSHVPLLQLGDGRAGLHGHVRGPRAGECWHGGRAMMSTTTYDSQPLRLTGLRGC